MAVVRLNLSAESTEAMRFKCLAQVHNILMSLVVVAEQIRDEMEYCAIRLKRNEGGWVLRFVDVVGCGGGWVVKE